MNGVRTDLWLVGTFLRHGGAARAGMVAGCTALVSGLVLVATTVVLFAISPGGTRTAAGLVGPETEVLANLVTDAGVRVGYVSGLALICVVPLILLRQVVRLGTADRERRLAGLRLAGASPAGVRRIGALEVGIPAAVGGLAGYAVFVVVRAMLGGRPASPSGYDAVTRELGLVPTTVAPAWWQVLLVAVLVGAVGAVAGAAATRSGTVSPLGVTRGASRTAPRPWGVGLVLVAALAFPVSAELHSSAVGTAFGVASVAGLVGGLATLSPWLAYRVGGLVAARTRTSYVLLAARRLVSDPRPAGRAAAAIGAIGMVAGFGGVLITELPASYGNRGFGQVEPLYTVPIALVGCVLLVALLLVVFTLAVHGVESLVDRRRAVASLAALGVTEAEMVRVQRWEVGLVALPMTAVGVVVGSLPYLFVGDWFGRYVWIPVLVDVVVVAFAWLGVLASTRLTRPWLHRMMSPAHIRTP